MEISIIDKVFANLTNVFLAMPTNYRKKVKRRLKHSLIVSIHFNNPEKDFVSHLSNFIS